MNCGSSRPSGDVQDKYGSIDVCINVIFVAILWCILRILVLFSRLEGTIILSHNVTL